ncbi:hypothetical protein BDB01DRAFT_732043 [Pilobolus umbonatus]|nr:hypothetical protein BDB01DRAFT_732043 [Pilobolus umbonatus]
MNRFIRYYHTKRKPSYEGYWDRILEKANGVPVTQSTKKPIPIPFYTEPPTSSSPPKVGKSVLFKGKIMPFPEKPAEPDNCCMRLE